MFHRKVLCGTQNGSSMASMRKNPTFWNLIFLECWIMTWSINAGCVSLLITGLYLWEWHLLQARCV